MCGSMSAIMVTSCVGLLRWGLSRDLLSSDIVKSGKAKGA